MPAVYLAIAPVLVALFIQIVGNGLVSTLIPLRAALEGFTRPEIGAIGSAYFIGMLTGCWAVPPIIASVGYIRAFAAYAALATVSVLGFTLIVQPEVWMALRCLLGFTLAGLYNIMECWVNARAHNKNRGAALAVYNVVHFSGSATGQQFLRFVDPKTHALFAISAIFFALSLIPMAMTRAEPPPPPQKGRVDIRGLFRAAPVGAVGIVLVGLANGTFWMLVPAVIERMALGPSVVAGFMTAVIAGSALAPYPLGKLSDHIDRRLVIVGTSIAAAIIEFLFFGLGAPSIWGLYALGFGIGTVLPVIYPLLSAHSNDRGGGDMVVTVASTMLFLYCVGGIIGPSFASLLMERYGDIVVFAHNGVLHVVLAVYVLLRIRMRAPPTDKKDSAAGVETPSPSNPQLLK